ncbi:MAG: threonine--tRNA ligase [Clostridia bacterium]
MGANDVTLVIDGRKEVVTGGTRLQDLAPDDAPVLAALLDGRPVDLARPVDRDGQVVWLSFQDDPGRRVFRHSSAHLLAQAIKRLWPQTKLGTGPALEDGYYYDVEPPVPITAQDLPRIEETMAQIVAENLPIERSEISRDEARRLFAERQETFKLEIVERLPDDAVISIYRQGEFVDLCSGPHVPSTGFIGAIRLTNVSGAYWRGDEANPMMTRVYGTSFPSQEDLEQHLARVEEARLRDHRRLGRELDLVQFREEAPGFAFWLPKGVRLYRALEQFSRDLQEPFGYEEVMTPWIYRSELWKQSGHWQNFHDNMFIIARDSEELGVKPMNCPGHCLLFKSETRSYRDLPIKWADYSPLSRFERSGTLNGLLRVRGFHQDDAHLYVRPDQIEEQIFECVRLVDTVARSFDLGQMEIEFSTRPEQYLGTVETWEHAEAELEAALQRAGRAYRINPGDGAFYGPKLDFYAIDALGRRWQLSTVQLDYQLPEQFDLHYVDQEGKPRRPVMIHRAIFGSLERFLGILIEHYAGAFPFWLAPEQVRVLPITEGQQGWAERIAADLRTDGVRVSVDGRREKLGFKIRAAQTDKVPVMLVAGAREAEAGQVGLRTRQQGDEGAKPWVEVREQLRSLNRRPIDA